MIMMMTTTIMTNDNHDAEHDNDTDHTDHCNNDDNDNHDNTEPYITLCYPTVSCTFIS